MRVSVVVVAYEEAPRIARVLAGMPALVDDVVVIDDASTDGTGEVARAAGARVIRHAKNRGVGAAIATGYRDALSRAGDARDAFVVMAGDGQMHPGDLPALLGPIARGDADYVKGDRFHHPEARRMPILRRLGGALFSRATSRALGVRVSDSQCGYTAITRAACAALDLSDLWPGYGYPNDLLGQLVVRRLRIAEVAVRPVYEDEESKLRVRHLPRIAWLVCRAWSRRVDAERALSRADAAERL